MGLHKIRVFDSEVSFTEGSFNRKDDFFQSIKGYEDLTCYCCHQTIKSG